MATSGQFQKGSLWWNSIVHIDTNTVENCVLTTSVGKYLLVFQIQSLTRSLIYENFHG